jgi:hypothetical protein
MERFARTIIGYHGCTQSLAQQLLLGHLPIERWQPSENEWDWLGHGVYFWEHSPQRAARWAREKYEPRGEPAAVIGAVIQLGRCFDPMDESITKILANGYIDLTQSYEQAGRRLPVNRGPEGKRRNLDCLVINDCLDRLKGQAIEYDTVRGAFTEGKSAYPGAGFAGETHIQVAVRNVDCILGVFQPKLGHE